MNDHPNELDIELYKFLRSEAASYAGKVPEVWLQKFILIGAAIAFLVTNHTSISSSQNYNVLLVSGILALPALAALLDAKIMEYALHACLISDFIITDLSKKTHNPSLAAWEDALWGRATDKRLQHLAKMRSGTTVLVTVVPTLLIILLSAVAIGVIVARVNMLITIAGVICVLYSSFTIYVYRRMWQYSESIDDSLLKISFYPKRRVRLQKEKPVEQPTSADS